MGTVNYVIALVLVVVLVLVDVLCVDISTKKRDYVSPIHRDNQNLPKPDQHPPNTSLSNLEWPDLGHNSRRNPHIDTSTVKTQNPLPNQTPSRQNSPGNSPWDTPLSTKHSPSHPQPNKPSYASVAFINNERGDGQVAPPQSGSISPTSSHNNNKNSPPSQSGTRSPTRSNPPSPQSGTQSLTSNNPPSPQSGTQFLTSSNPPSSQSGTQSLTSNNPLSPQSGTRSPTSSNPPSPQSGTQFLTSNNPLSPQSGARSPTSSNPPSPQSGTQFLTSNNPLSPQSGARSPTSNNPSLPSGTRSPTNNNPSSHGSSQSFPQSWPRPPANPQSHLKPVSASGNKRPDIVETNTQDGNTNERQTNPAEDQELREFSENLLRKEINSAMNTITVNYQGKTTSRSLKDEAPLPLIAVTNATYQIATIERLRPLYDNYILETTQNEHVTPMEREEENKLLDAIENTQVMRFTRNFLIDKGKIGKDPKEFRDYLKQIWFTMYSRGKGRIGSSGFEHVFLSEIKEGQISGLHNWLYFYEEESKGNADYLGYMKKIEFGNKGSILKYHFKFRNIDKPVGSMFIGTSPEFEMALYTTCFALRANRICPLQLDGKRFIIRTYSMRYRGKENIGSAFPEI